MRYLEVIVAMLVGAYLFFTAGQLFGLRADPWLLFIGAAAGGLLPGLEKLHHKP